MAVTAKICGLSDEASVDAAAGGATHLGFVFYPGSPRDVGPDRAAALARRAPPGTSKVAVLVDAGDEAIAQVVAAGMDTLQLHGGETPERAAALRARFGVPVWKAIPVRTRADLDAARRYRGAADRIVYDARTPPGALPGGMGLRFDWTLLDGFAHPLPWILSGGLDAASVAEAVGVTGARMVDVSSGVESAPGVKDVDKIAAFLQALARL